MWSDFVGTANRLASHAHSAARHLIPRVWRVDPLGCPACQNPMRVIAVIDDPPVVEKTLRYLALACPPTQPPRACRGSRLLAGQFVLQSREGTHWHLDETRWPMLCLQQGQGRQLWWFWVVVSPEVTAFLLEPTRSGQVPQDFFPKGTQGIVSVDRYAGYFALLGPDWSLKLAYCWSHQRRDFVNGVQVADQGQGWADQWVELINQLFGTNAQRRRAWFQGPRVAFGPLDQPVRQQVAQIKERLDRELASGHRAGAVAPKLAVAKGQPG